MSLETCFSLAGAVAAVGWALLVFLPRWRWSAHVIGPVLIPALLALVYAVLLVPRILASEGDFGSLAGVATLFETPELLLAGWIHYLAFDLFVGSWEVRDARRVGIPHVLVLPCLAGTFLLGPVGLVAYLALRAKQRGLWIDESAV